MDKTDKINEFRQYMLCGHGRCFSLIQKDRELYRENVLYGCLNDISYDLQCEGSRGQFMYNLALEYEEYDYFLDAAIEKFLSADINEDWHLINHLCELIDMFAHDNGDISAEKALDAKYRELYGLLMTLRWSEKANRILQCFEALAITIMQSCDIDRAAEIIRDIGAYFIRRRSASDDGLYWDFAWFTSVAETTFGQRKLRHKLRKLAENSKEIRRFVRIMFVKKKRLRVKRRVMTAEEYIEKAEKGIITRRDVLKISFSESDERLKVAEAAVAESSPEIKASLLQAFTISRNRFPFDAEIIADYAESDNEKLRLAAMDVLLYMRSEKSREIALKQLEENYSVEALALFICNCSRDDTEYLMGYLNALKIDRDEGDWHYAVLKALDNAENLPDKAVVYIYEKSMCSCCRRDAVEELIRRGAFTEEMAEECRMDANCDIRELAEKFERSLNNG